jgi:diaminopimelate decarboxylase
MMQQRIDMNRIGASLRAILASGRLTDEAPFLVALDLDMIEARVREAKAAFPSNTLHAIAIKANPLIPVLRRVVALGAGLEAASMGEVALGLAAGCAPDKIVLDSPAKTTAELHRALELGIRINLDNFEELRRCAAILTARPDLTPAGIGIRVNPEVGQGSIALTSVAARGSKFGVGLSGHRQELLDAYTAYPWLTGLHIHIGSQGCELAMLAEGARRIEQLARQIEAAAGRPLKTLDIGGGLPVPYHEDEQRAGFAEYTALLAQTCPRWMTGEVELITEFGRVIHANAGFAVSRVEFVKPDDQGGDIAMLHMGADLALRRAYVPDQWHYEFSAWSLAGRRLDGKRVPTTLAGPLCFSGDLLARRLMLPELAPADLIIMHDIGGYTFSMWSRYCSRAFPEVVGIHGTTPDLFVIRPREEEADLVRFWGGGGDSVGL